MILIWFCICLCQIHWSHVVSREWRCVWNFGTASTGDAPTTSEWSTILFTTKVQLILEVWWYSFILRKLSTPYSLIWVYMLVDNSPFCLIWILFKSICFLQAKKNWKKIWNFHQKFVISKLFWHSVYMLVCGLVRESCISRHHYALYTCINHLISNWWMNLLNDTLFKVTWSDEGYVYTVTVTYTHKTKSWKFRHILLLQSILWTAKYTSGGTYTSVGWHIVRKFIMCRPEHKCSVAHCLKINISAG